MINILYNKLKTKASNLKVVLENQLEKMVERRYHPGAKFAMYSLGIKERLEKENVVAQYLQIDGEKSGISQSLWYINAPKR